eukprot:CAMPEP_0203885158 /NCGR_PEP_ID=MMETSP0359-20131031/29161_1 /ASSEMBLY_ACC=CAM_ASM_000338 /TAXON_ID=268821 /ORGANISM="Scrippsiella Hangoei, Strain SHTV-5" /LENGTH=78 /DNA_ID=CAMNT_0050805743 /DNA_START=41 /DNA_END=279 /DNA_ORIENTATION=+
MAANLDQIIDTVGGHPLRECPPIYTARKQEFARPLEFQAYMLGVSDIKCCHGVNNDPPKSAPDGAGAAVSGSTQCDTE